jgi:RHS repeat-associated protein
MRFLLLFLSLFLQVSASGDDIHVPQRSHAFVPAARITDSGVPVQMYDANGAKPREVDLNIYGRVRTFAARSLSDCPFRYQGQYQDEETGLYYNRFRYYDPTTGVYLSQDPIGLAGGNPTLYGYVKDVNSWVDIFGLSGRGGSTHRDIQDQVFGDLEKIHGKGNVQIEREIDLGNGSSRYGDVIVRGPATGKITEVHQVGDIRSRGGFRPSSRERGAIMDIRQSPDLVPDAKIIFHDKKGRVALINPDKSLDWKAPKDKHRKLKGGAH